MEKSALVSYESSGEFMLGNILRLIYLLGTIILSNAFWRVCLLRLAPQKCAGLRKNLGTSLSQLVQRLGPSYIKLGQFLSTRPDLIGFKMADQLAELQDSLKPSHFPPIERVLKESLGGKLTDHFKSFEKKAAAAASIAQVYRAQLHNGEEVAVKVLRPRIEKIIACDLKLFHSIARFLELWSKTGKRLKARKIVINLEKAVNIELDLRMEAACGDKLRENLQYDSDIIIPQIFWSLTSRRVMVTHWCNGVPINDRQKIATLPIKPQKIAEKLAITLFNQAFRDGFFHADLHPGNILVNEQGKIILLDFGIMGTLDHSSRIFLADMLHGFITKDYDKVARLHFEIGYVPKEESEAWFSLACRSIGEPIIGLPVSEVSIAQLIRQLFQVSRNFNIELQPQLILLQKTLVTVEGVGFSLDPHVNMWQLAEPWIQEWGKKNLSGLAKLKKISRKYKEIIADLPETIRLLEEVVGDIAARQRKKK